MLFILIPIKAFLLLLNIVKFHRAVYLTTALLLLKLACAEINTASDICLKEHNRISLNIEFMANCKKEEQSKDDSDSTDPEKHLCFMMRWYCTMECTTCSYGGQCSVESIFTLNLKMKSDGTPETLNCVCSYEDYKPGCYNTYDIKWAKVLDDFKTNCSTPPVVQVLLIGAYDLVNDGKSMEIYDTEEPGNNRIVDTELSMARKLHVSGVFADGTVAVAGGEISSKVTGETELYKSKTNEIIAGPHMAEARSSPGAAMFNNKLVVCGGSDSNLIYTLKTCEALIFDGSNKFHWELFPSLIEDRYNAAMVELNGYLYIIGGWKSGLGPVKMVERYDTATNSWKNITTTPTERNTHAAAVLNDIIYICGGFNTKKQCETYDPVSDKWGIAASLNTDSENFNLLPLNGKLYAFTGGDSKIVESYSPENDQWVIMTKRMIKKRHSSTAVLLKK